MKRTIISFLLLSALAFAQRSGNPPDPATVAQHRVDRLTTLLSLTTDQQQQAKTIFTNAATAGTAAHDSMRAAHESLAAAVKKNDIATIDQASTTIGNLTAQLISIDAKANAAFYQILTADQQSKFDSQGPGRFGAGPGPGGFGRGAGPRGFRRGGQ